MALCAIRALPTPGDESDDGQPLERAKDLSASRAMWLVNIEAMGQVVSQGVEGGPNQESEHS